MDRSKLKAPYIANIFSYKRSTNLEGYRELDELTMNLAKKTEGFLGYEVTGDGSEHAIFISYWKDMEAVQSLARKPGAYVSKTEGKNAMVRVVSFSGL